MLVLKRLLSILGRTSTLRDGLLLVVLCAAVYLPGITAISAVDRDEARFAQASRQMFEAAALPSADRDPRLHSGGWAVPYLCEKPRLNKPPLVYWLQVASAWTFTGGEPLKDAIWMYRVPSMLAAIGSVLVTWRLGKAMFNADIGRMAGSLLAVSPIFVWDAHQARSDQVMVFFTTASVFALYRCCAALLAADGTNRAPLGATVVLHASIAAGVMTKGPVTLMVVVLAVMTAAYWLRSWRWIGGLRPGLFLVILAASVGPWLWAVAQQQGGILPYLRGVWEEFFVRAAAGSKEGHFGPPGFHTVLLAVLFWPGSLVTLAALGRAWQECFGAAAAGDERLQSRFNRIKARAAAVLRARASEFSPSLLLLAAIVPSWLLFELSPAKLPHYTMPLYPLVAVLTARALCGGVVPATAGRIIWWLVGGGPIVVVAIGLILLFVPRATDGGASESGTWPTQIVITLAAGLAVVFAIAAGSVVIRQRFAAAMVIGTRLAIIAAVCVFGPVLAFAVPVLAPGKSSEELRMVLVAVDAGKARPWATTNLDDSLAFATRARATQIKRTEVDSWLDAHPDGLVVVRWDAERGGGTPLPSGTRDVGQLAAPGYQRVNGWVIVERAP